MKIRTLTLSALMIFVAFGANATKILSGFRYADEKAPTGKEWESPEDLALNKEQPRLLLFVSRQRECTQSTSQKFCLLEIFGRNVEIQLGKTSR